MKIGTNFNTRSYSNAKELQIENCGEDFLITRFHKISFFLKHSIYFFMIMLSVLSMFLLTWYDQVYYIPHFMVFIVGLILYILYGYLKFLSSYIVVNKDELVITTQKSLFRRSIHILLMKNIAEVVVRSPSILCTFLWYGTITIHNQANIKSQIIPYFPEAQKNQKIIRNLWNLWNIW